MNYPNDQELQSIIKWWADLYEERSTPEALKANAYNATPGYRVAMFEVRDEFVRRGYKLDLLDTEQRLRWYTGVWKEAIARKFGDFLHSAIGSSQEELNRRDYKEHLESALYRKALKIAREWGKAREDEEIDRSWL